MSQSSTSSSPLALPSPSSSSSSQSSSSKGKSKAKNIPVNPATTAQAFDTWPATEVDRSEKLKAEHIYDGKLSEYVMWSNRVIGYLKGKGIVHHLFIDEDDPLPSGPDDLQEIRLANRAAVSNYLTIVVKGKAEAVIADPDFHVRPREMWEALRDSFGIHHETEISIKPSTQVKFFHPS